MTNWTIHSAPHLRGEITVPGDKSISHRALMFAALAEGDSHIRNLLLGEDVLSTMQILQQLGVRMSHRPDEIKAGEILTVYGEGLHSLKPSQKTLDCGNSGTTMRLMMGLLSAQPFESILTGDHSLNKRPMERVMNPLTEMGARFSIEHKGGERFITVKGSKKLNGNLTFHLPVASAQVKSALLLAGLYAKGETLIVEPMASRDHTERILASQGARLFKKKNEVLIHSCESLKPVDITVPGDFSSAAFFLVGGLIVPHSEILLRDVGVNPTRSALLDVLRTMGGHIEVRNERLVADEPIADLYVQTSNLLAYDLKGPIIPKLIDEIPIFAVAAAQARGTTTVSNAEELRVKESDRIAVLAGELRKIGVTVEEKQDGLIITGEDSLHGGTVLSHGDHRIAMALAIAGLTTGNHLEIMDIDCVATSFPDFFQKLHSLAHSASSGPILCE